MTRKPVKKYTRTVEQIIASEDASNVQRLKYLENAMNLVSLCQQTFISHSDMWKELDAIYESLDDITQNLNIGDVVTTEGNYK